MTLSLVALAAATLTKGFLAPLLFGLIWVPCAASSWGTDGKKMLRFVARPSRYEAKSAVGFYTRQAVTPVIDSESNDLWWGQIKDPRASAFFTTSDVLRRAHTSESSAIFVPRHERKRFLQSPLGAASTVVDRREAVATFLIRTDLAAVEVEAPLP